VATLFIFIVTANLLALVPGFLGSFFVRTAAGAVPLFKSPNSDLTMTLALALFSVFSIQYFSVTILGLKEYLGRFFDWSGPIAALLGLFALLSESIRIVSFSFRLFGNIFAGEVLLLVVAFLVPYILPLPFMILELFVGIIQAFIFAILTLAFIRSSSLPALGS
jgi:F-type H+-transporting ATPase subunit a